MLQWPSGRAPYYFATTQHIIGLLAEYSYRIINSWHLLHFHPYHLRYMFDLM